MGNIYYNTKSIFWLHVYNNHVLLLYKGQSLSPYSLPPIKAIAYNHIPHLYDYKKIEKIL